MALDVAKIASETDVVLITQGLDDHCSMPTLEQLPRELPIVAAPEAAARIADLGFASVTTLRHGQAADVCDGRLHVEATPGALVGPPWSRRQNGYVLSENLRGGGTSLYYEPHCDFDRRALKSLGQVDIVVSPITSTLIKVPSLGLDYPLVSGDINLMELLTGLAPRVLIPLLNNEIEQEGDLTKYLTESGAGPDELRAALAERRILTRVEMPAPPGEALAIAL